MKKIAVILTNQEYYGNTDNKTGLFLGEATQFVDEVSKAGYDVDFISPKGGKVPIDPSSLEKDNMDEIDTKIYQSEDFQNRALKNSLKPSEVNFRDYDAIYYSGGHGVLWDFADTKDLQDLAVDIYKNNGYISSVCHGVAGLLNLKVDGKYIIEGKKINGFTNEEEDMAGKKNLIPYFTEDELIKRGAEFKKGQAFENFAIRDGRFITGQNQNSPRQVAKKLIQAMNE